MHWSLHWSLQSSLQSRWLHQASLQTRCNSLASGLQRWLHMPDCILIIAIAEVIAIGRSYSPLSIMDGLIIWLFAVERRRFRIVYGVGSDY